MELILLFLFFIALLFLFIALFELPFVNKIQRQVKESYEVLPRNTSLNEIAPDIGYVFPDAIPLTTTTIRMGRGSQRMTVHVPNCPTCGKYLRAIDGKYGKFWGCTGYPNCHYTRSYS